MQNEILYETLPEAQIALETKVSKFTTQYSTFFTYPTYTADVYKATIEEVRLPVIEYPEINVKISATPGYTGLNQNCTFRRTLLNKLKNPTQKRLILDYSGQFIYDSRYDTEKNIGHVIDHIFTQVLLAQKLLSERLKRQIKIHVVLRANAAEMGRSAYEAIGIPTICTDQSVRGNIVEISSTYLDHNGAEVPSPYDLFNAQPSIFADLDFRSHNPQTPERIFVPRRGSRSLINNDEVVQFLQARGFTTVYFEDLSHAEKWAYVQNAKAAVVVHGAGSANFSFNSSGLAQPDQPGSGLRLLEIFSPNFMLSGFHHLADTFNGRWCGVRGQITPQTLRYLDFDNKPRDVFKAPLNNPIKVHLQSIERALDYLGVD